MIDLDRSYHWFWCGSECEALLYGPFPSLEYALANIEGAKGMGCEHDHIPFASTTADIMRTFPPPRDHGGGYYSEGFSICRSGREMWRVNSYATVVKMSETYNVTMELAKMLNSRSVAAAPHTVEDDLPTLQRSAGSRG